MPRSTTSLLAGSAAMLSALVLVGSLRAENPRKKVPVRQGQTDVHQMELYNGPSRTVRNFGASLSPGETSALRDLERLENEASYAQDLLTLKRQYVLSERLLEPHRRAVQLDLYGRDITINNSSSASVAGNYGGYGYGYPNYFFGGYGMGSPGAVASASNNETEFRSLATGMGNEGVLKNAIVATIGQQATPTYAASLARDYERAASLATASRRLQVGLRLPTLDSVRAENKAVADAETAISAPRVITLTLKNGEKIRGTKINYDKDWATVDLLGGGTSRVRHTEVMRIDTPTGGETPSSSGILPASKPK